MLIFYGCFRSSTEIADAENSQFHHLSTCVEFVGEALDGLQRQMSGFVSVLGLDMQQGQAVDYQVYPVTASTSKLEEELEALDAKVGATVDAACCVIVGKRDMSGERRRKEGCKVEG